MNKQHVSEEDLDLRGFFNILYRYKWSAVIIIFIFTMAALIYAYYKPNVYEAKATIEINVNEKGDISNGDILKEALLGKSIGGSIDTEKNIIKSRFIVLDAMKRVNVTTYINGINILRKSISLYENAPFQVEVDERGKNLKFTVSDINDKGFNLSVKGVDSKTGQKFSYNGVHGWNREVKSKHFKLKLTKTGKPFIYSKYTFVVYTPVRHADNLRQNDISVNKLGKKSNVLQISYKDNSPLRAKEFVNMLTKVYMEQNIRTKTREATQTLDFINKQLRVIEKNLKKSEKNLEKFKMENKTVNVTQSATQISSKLSDYENELAQLNMQINMLDNVASQIARGRSLTTITIAGIGINTQSISSLISELQQAILQKNTLLKNYTPAHPDVQAISDKIRKLKVIIRSSLNNMIKTLKNKRSLIKANMAKYQEKLKTLPTVQQNYLSLERNFSFNDKFYSYLLQKRTETQIKKASTVNNYRIVDPAILPMRHVQPKRKMIVALGLVLGLIAAIVYALFRNYLDDTIKNRKDLKNLTDIPIIAEIPHIDKDEESDGLLTILSKPKSSVAESFRLLRGNLLFMLNEKSSQVISVTSTIGGEGKTTISANLGAALRMLGKRVIIVSFDLRKPRLHKEFNVENKIGVSHFLAGKVALDEIITHTQIEDLDILTSGAVPPNPSELISSKKTQELLDALKERYDFIILDTPPVGLVIDAQELFFKSDIVIYTTRSLVTKKDFIEIVNDLKFGKDIKHLCIVINDVKSGQTYGGKYGYKYGYYNND